MPFIPLNERVPLTDKLFWRRRFRQKQSSQSLAIETGWSPPTINKLRKKLGFATLPANGSAVAVYSKAFRKQCYDLRLRPLAWVEVADIMGVKLPTAIRLAELHGPLPTMIIKPAKKKKSS